MKARDTMGFAAFAGWLGVALTIQHWPEWLDVPSEHWVIGVIGGVSGIVCFWCGHVIAGEFIQAKRWREHQARMERRVP